MLIERSSRITKQSLNICESCICLYPSSVLQCPACGRFSKTRPLRKYRRKVFFTLVIAAIIFSFIALPVSIILLIVLILNIIVSAKDYRHALRNGGYYFSLKAQKIKDRESRGQNLEETKVLVPGRSSFDEHRYSSGDYFDDFESQLAVVWADKDINIEFSYRRPNGDTSRRKILLHEVLVNDDMEPYFKGLCYEAADIRIFKYKRLTSKILYEGVKYHKDDFIEEVLCLPRDDFYY